MPHARHNALLPLQVRTSTGMFHENGVDDIVSAIEERVAEVTMIPAGVWEAVRVRVCLESDAYVLGLSVCTHHTQSPTHARGVRFTVASVMRASHSIHWLTELLKVG